MFRPLFKRVEIFQPYHIPIHSLIISQEEDPIPSPKNSKMFQEKNKKEILFESDQPQNDTSSTSGGDLEKPEKKQKKYF